MHFREKEKAGGKSHMAHLQEMRSVGNSCRHRVAEHFEKQDWHIFSFICLLHVTGISLQPLPQLSNF